jgi:hypothetical protein
MTTDTPRTDAARERYFDGKTSDWVHYTIAMMLERELNASEAERDEARKALILNLQTTGGMPWREWSAECAKETRRADENLERAEKAEAEVERLRAEVQRAIEDRNRIGIKIRGEYLPKLKETNNEVARLRSEITLREDLDAVAQDVWDELKAENARLRELLTRAIDNCECEPKCSSHFASYCDCGRYARNEVIREELAQ